MDSVTSLHACNAILLALLIFGSALVYKTFALTFRTQKRICTTFIHSRPATLQNSPQSPPSKIRPEAPLSTFPIPPHECLFLPPFNKKKPVLEVRKYYYNYKKLKKAN
ncbi:hypothetical protein K469DRAFT_708422 [Zopfia rhizophila CBS 207.26]|uniref:Uncharacterized protein n=1 Tax=Zopfia rhizophila CBS 207.26 TaxID=1314779 RepID=A0A6A6E4P2_9PEZI|nr:hypothetical protein K469DRAFT_708422 [Zopfia rhizophila CBS 207.26]